MVELLANIDVDDLERGVAFYQALGLSCLIQFNAEGYDAGLGPGPTE